MDRASTLSLLSLVSGHNLNELENLQPGRYEELNELFLDAAGNVKLLPSEVFRNECTHDELRVWCHYHAFYQLPTIELIDFISQHITGKAIEIGSGSGNVGRHLGIPLTDSKVQENDPYVQEQLKLFNQPRLQYPADVLEMEAGRALNRLKPDTVIACWVTEWNNAPNQKSFYKGVDEKNILIGKKYILVGNENIHADKYIMKFPHEKFKFPWIVSRAIDQTKNAIWIWDKTIRW